MARRAKGSTKPFMHKDQALDLERARFLRTLDHVAPHLWPELRGRPVRLARVSGTREGKTVLLGEYEARRWCIRHHLGDTWAPLMAWRRVQDEAFALKHGNTRSLLANQWLPLGNVDQELDRLEPTIGFDTRPPRWPLRQTRAKYFDDLMDWIERQELLRTTGVNGEPGLGFVAYVPIPEKDLERTARWQVLGESPETLAKREIKAGDKRSLHTLAELIRRNVKSTAERLELPPRPQGIVGRPPRRAVP